MNEGMILNENSVPMVLILPLALKLLKKSDILQLMRKEVEH